MFTNNVPGPLLGTAEAGETNRKQQSQQSRVVNMMTHIQPRETSWRRKIFELGSYILPGIKVGHRTALPVLALMLSCCAALSKFVPLCVHWYKWGRI